MRTAWTLVGLGLVSVLAVACGGSSQADDENGDFGSLSGDEAELKGKTLSIPNGGSKSFSFQSTNGGSVSIAIDCGISQDPDTVGPVFTVDAPDLQLPSSETPKAGAFAWAGAVSAGTHTITLNSVSGSAQCSVKVGGVAGTCKTYKSYHSPNTNHTHFAVGTDTSSDWEAFPASGNHWGAWSPWNKVYTAPVKRAFLLHNLEHGGVVLSYKCDSNATTECAAAEGKLKDMATGMGLQRYLITPDPTQPELFAVRAWRWLFTSSCLNETAAKSFINAHIRHGREDIDADPPIAFDPTTMNVPCQDLMAAPDSCY